MKILHVLGKLDPGGVESWLVQVLRQIDRSRFQSDVMVHRCDQGAYDAEVRKLGVRVIPCAHPEDPIVYARNFLRVLRKYGPYDVVHSHVHFFSSYVLLLAACAGVPVRLAHSHTDSRLLDTRAARLRKLYSNLMKLSLPHVATGGFAVSSEAGDALFPSGWTESSRWRLLHLGIELSRFSGQVASDSLRKQLGLPKASLVIGHIGRMDENKNQIFILSVATEVLKLRPEAMFLLVGDGPMRSFLQQATHDAQLAEHFVFTGIRSDVPDLLRGAMDVFIFPSRLEGLPITLLEAQAAGLPCLVSDAVTPEADVASDSIMRLPLEASAAKWAEALIDIAQQPRPSSAEACSTMTPRSIKVSAQSLMDAYERFAQHAS